MKATTKKLNPQSDLLAGHNGTFPMIAIETAFYPAQNGLVGEERVKPRSPPTSTSAGLTKWKIYMTLYADDDEPERPWYWPPR